MGLVAACFTEMSTRCFAGVNIEIIKGDKHESVIVFISLIFFHLIGLSSAVGLKPWKSCSLIGSYKLVGWKKSVINCKGLHRSCITTPALVIR